MWLTTAPQRAGICCPPNSHPILFNSFMWQVPVNGPWAYICEPCHFMDTAQKTGWALHGRSCPSGELECWDGSSREHTAPISLAPEWQHSLAHLRPTELFWTWSLNLKANVFLLSHWVISFKLLLHTMGIKQYLAKIISICLLTRQSYF